MIILCCFVPIIQTLYYIVFLSIICPDSICVFLIIAFVYCDIVESVIFSNHQVFTQIPVRQLQMTFLTMLSLILLSMLMMLFFILSVTRHLIYGNNLNWLLNFNLIYEALWTGVRSGLLILMLGKLSWFCLTSLITMVLLM